MWSSVPQKVDCNYLNIAWMSEIFLPDEQNKLSRISLSGWLRMHQDLE